MTSQESQVDLQKIKQAFAEILLRKKAAADDPVESVASLFADPEPAEVDDPVESVAAPFAEDAQEAEDGEDATPAEPEPAAAAPTQPAASAATSAAGTDVGDAEEGDADEDAPLESVAGLYEEVAVAGSGYSQRWREFLAMYGDQWDGEEETWSQFRAWIDLFAKKQGVFGEAQTFLNAAEAEGDPAARIAFFARHGVKIKKKKVTGEKTADPAADRPSQDAEGRKVDVFLSEKKETDGAGEFYWVRIHGELGKLYAKGHKFVTEENAELAKRPTHDARGRRIEEFRSGKAGEDFVARIGDVWGRLDGEQAFVALYPEDSVYADWSTRVVAADGYRQSEVHYPGTWHKPWHDQEFYLLERAGGLREWARGNQGTAAGPGQTVAKVLGGKAGPYYGEL